MFASAPHSSPASKSAAAFFGHEIRSLDGDVRPGYRELDSLVLPDRTPEDLALLRSIRRPLDEETSVAHALGGD
jgi:hypothetical protein